MQLPYVSPLLPKYRVGQKSKSVYSCNNHLVYCTASQFWSIFYPAGKIEQPRFNRVE